MDDGDHYKYHSEYEKSGIPIFAPFLTDERKAQFGGFKIKAFDNPHGDITSYGFYIEHEDFGKLIFVTDAELVKYSFKDMKVNHIMIEANYQNDLLDMGSVNFEHKVRGHCSLDTAAEFIRHNNSPELRTVTLIHSNPTTLDEKGAVERIKGIVDADVNICVACAGMEIELKKEAF